MVRDIGGCGYAIAGEHLITMRQSYATYCDADTGKVHQLKGFRPGCRNSLLPADGVLCAPAFAHGCACNLGIFTSLGLIHQPGQD